MELTVYAYAKCGTCRKALKWLREQGHVLTEIPIVDEPPGADELEALIDRSGVDVRKFFNTSGEAYKAMNLKEKLKTMSRDEMIALLASNGRLIKRPIVTDGRRATVGFDEETFAQVWSNT
jgi:arsenate reductase